MPLARFLISPDVVLREQGTIVLRGGEAHHLIQVRRLGPSNFVELINGLGLTAKAKVIRVNSTEVILDIAEVFKQQNDCLPIMLVVAMLKANRMSWMIQKATELGVKAIYPVITHYSVIKVDTEKASTYLNRWKSIALQSLKQCRGNFLPIIHSPDSLERTLKKVSCAKAKIVLWEQEKKRSLFSAWNEQGNDIPVSIIAGPEGGFSREEITACRDAGFSSATMGKRTLRSETAAIGAVAAITAIMTFGLEKEH